MLQKENSFLSSKLVHSTNYQEKEKKNKTKQNKKIQANVLSQYQQANFSISDGVGGGESFWVNLVLPELFFQRLHSSWIFFWSIFLHQMFFFSASNMEKLPLSLSFYPVSTTWERLGTRLQHSHISERFRVGVRTKLATWEFDVVLEIENPRPKEIEPK